MDQGYFSKIPFFYPDPVEKNNEKPYGGKPPFKKKPIPAGAERQRAQPERIYQLKKEDCIKKGHEDGMERQL